MSWTDSRHIFQAVGRVVGLCTRTTEYQQLRLEGVRTCRFLGEKRCCREGDISQAMSHVLQCHNSKTLLSKPLKLNAGNVENAGKERILQLAAITASVPFTSCIIHVQPLPAKRTKQLPLASQSNLSPVRVLEALDFHSL